MASIRTSIELHDNISSSLMHITSSLNMTVSAFEDMNETANSSFDSSAFDGVRDHINQANIEINEMTDNINQAEREQQRFNNSLDEGTSAASGLEDKLVAFIAAYATIQTLQKTLNTSDMMVQTTARLNLMNDGLQTTKELQDMIYLSAEKSRTSYQMTADMVSKLGMNAKDAFGSNVELINFAEQLNKSMVIAGTEAQGVESTIYNLTQALSTGVLRGQDLNAVMSNAPNIVQNIADYLDVPIGKIRDLAADGQITAEIVKNAMLSATDATNEAFESMPKTFGQIWTSISNDAVMAFDPVLERLNEIGNSEGLQTMVAGITNSLVFVSGLVIEIFDLIAQVSAFMADNWSILEPIILGLATAFGIYTAALIVYNTIQGITNIIKGIAAFQSSVHAAGLMMETGATFAATAAQHGFNAALLACPLTWIILAIIAVIAVIYLAVAAFNKFAGTSVSATGIIVGVLMVGAAFIGNLFVTLINLLIDIFGLLWNRIATFAEFFANVFNDPVGSIVRLFAGMADNILGILEGIASAIDTLFGSNLASAVSGWRSSLSGMVTDLVGDAEIKIPRMDTSAMHLDRFEYGAAYDSGYAFGEGVENTIKDFDIGSIFDSNIPDPSDYSDVANGMGSIPSNVGDIASNTGAMKDSIDLSTEELKYMRDLADMEAINRFTTAKIEVDMTGMQNTITNEMDLDGVISYLGEGIEEQMEIIAEGVHE
ncbi:MAG TPA: tape measure protein [Bacteroidales bacterium]|nr:tape measure protein [Bacteroidales bacterium]